ncbi:MAG: hypothetical protein ABI068_11495 [Ktedonobacterales bacterium]
MLAMYLLALFAGCGAASGPSLASIRLPPWQLLWSQPQNGIPVSLSPQEAFVRGARVYYQSAPVPLAAITLNWLATGPPFGLALARLDPAATFQDVVLLYSTPQTGWIGDATTVRNGAPCQSQDSQRQVNSVTFPQPVCSVGNLGKIPTATQPWDYLLTSWFATGQTYLSFTSASASIQRPSAASGISMAGTQGWRYQQGDIETITQFTAPSHTGIFACLNDAQHCQSLAMQALQ